MNPWDDDEVVERYEQQCWERRQEDMQRERRAKPLWQPPNDDASKGQLVTHHRSCRDAAHVECPICCKKFSAVQFCGGAYEAESHACKHKKRQWKEMSQQALGNEIGLSARKVCKYVRLVVQYCSPHEGMSEELLRTFPGWPLKLNKALCDWVHAYVSELSHLPPKSFDYKHFTDSGPDSDTFEDDAEDGADELRLLRTFRIDLSAAAEYPASLARMRTVKRLSAGKAAVPSLSQICAVRLAAKGRPVLKKLAQKRYPREVCELVYQAWQASKAPGSEYATCVSCYSSLGFAHDGCSKCGGGCCHNGECAPECSACNKMFCMWCSHMHDSKCAACGEVSILCDACDPGDGKRDVDVCRECAEFPKCNGCKRRSSRCASCRQAVCTECSGDAMIYCSGSICMHEVNVPEMCKSCYTGMRRCPTSGCMLPQEGLCADETTSMCECCSATLVPFTQGDYTRACEWLRDCRQKTQQQMGLE